MEGEDVFALFEQCWAKFVTFVKNNAHVLNDLEKQKMLVEGIDRRPELALLVLRERLPPLAPMIENKDLDAILGLFPPTLGLANIKFPPEVIEKGFAFARVFLGILEDLK